MEDSAEFSAADFSEDDGERTPEVLSPDYDGRNENDGERDSAASDGEQNSEAASGEEDGEFLRRPGMALEEERRKWVESEKAAARKNKCLPAPERDGREVEMKRGIDPVSANYVFGSSLLILRRLAYRTRTKMRVLEKKEKGRVVKAALQIQGGENCVAYANANVDLLLH